MFGSANFKRGVAATVTAVLLALQWIAAAHVPYDCHGRVHEHHAQAHAALACCDGHTPPASSDPSLDEGTPAPDHHPADCPVCRLAHFRSLAGEAIPVLLRATAAVPVVVATREGIHPRRALHAHGARAPPLPAPVS